MSVIQPRIVAQRTAHNRGRVVPNPGLPNLQIRSTVGPWGIGTIIEKSMLPAASLLAHLEMGTVIETAVPATVKTAVSAAPPTTEQAANNENATLRATVVDLEGQIAALKTKIHEQASTIANLKNDLEAAEQMLSAAGEVANIVGSSERQATLRTPVVKSPWADAPVDPTPIKTTV